MIRPTAVYATDRELLGNPDPNEHGAIELAFVTDVGGKHYDLEDGGVTLVQVRLVRGRPGAQQTLWCRISQPLNQIPAVNTQVIVAVPAGFGYAPGMPMIIAAAGPAPPNQYGAQKAKLDFGENFDLVIKARSITLTDYENRFITIGPTYGIKMGDADANGACCKDGQWLMYVADGGDAKATLKLHKDEICLLHKKANVTALKLDGDVTLAGKTLYAKTSGGYLGMTIASAAMNGIAYSSAGPVNAISPSWMVSSS